MRRSSRPSRYAFPKSAARSCAVMKYALNPERMASSASATLKCVFPTPGGPKNHVAGFVNESQRTQLPNLPIIQRWLKTEIELFEGFHKGEMRQLQSRPQIPSPSCFHLAAQQLIEKVRIARLFLRRLFQQVLEPGFHRL